MFLQQFCRSETRASTVVGTSTLVCLCGLGWRFIVARRRYNALFLKPARPLQKKLRVAILGAGVGGAALAHWLREIYREDLELTVISDGPVGGRCQAIDFENRKYEAGASIISELNEHFIGFMKKFHLKERCVKDLAFIPSGIFDGEQFLFRSCSPRDVRFPFLAKLVTTWRLLCRFGFFSLRRLKNIAKGSEAPNFKRLYGAQRSGKVFQHPRDLLRVLGSTCEDLTRDDAQSWLHQTKKIPAHLIDELATAGMRANYGGQSCKDLHAFVGLVSLAGGVASRCFGVHGGNDQVPKQCLESANPCFEKATAKWVKKLDGDKGQKMFQVAYDPAAHGEAMKDSLIPLVSEHPSTVVTDCFDVVVVAHALERSELVLQSCNALTPQRSPQAFRRCVTHFVKGCLRSDFFKSVDKPPLEVLTVAGSSAPFYSIGLQMPVSVSSSCEAQEIVESALRGEPQVFKVFAPDLLGQAELSRIFSAGHSSDKLSFEVVDWYAYPCYSVPQELYPFVLDPDGIFYLNSIEQVASAMEMSLISARNAVNLVVDWVDRHGKQRGLTI